VVHFLGDSKKPTIDSFPTSCNLLIERKLDCFRFAPNEILFHFLFLLYFLSNYNFKKKKKMDKIIKLDRY